MHGCFNHWCASLCLRVTFSHDIIKMSLCLHDLPPLDIIKSNLWPISSVHDWAASCRSALCKWCVCYSESSVTAGSCGFLSASFGEGGGGRVEGIHQQRLSALWKHAPGLQRGKGLDISDGWLATGTMWALSGSAVATGRGSQTEMDMEIRPEHSVTR